MLSKHYTYEHNKHITSISEISILSDHQIKEIVKISFYKHSQETFPNLIRELLSHLCELRHFDHEPSRHDIRQPSHMASRECGNLRTVLSWDVFWQQSSIKQQSSMYHSLPLQRSNLKFWLQGQKCPRTLSFNLAIVGHFFFT